MKDSFLFPIIFMLIMVILFVGILAIMYRVSEPKIEAYKLDSFQRQVLALMAGKIAEATAMDAAQIMADYPSSFETYILPVELHDMDRQAFQAVVGDSVVAYCFEIKGKGLWGSMKGLISTTTDLKTIVDFAIVDQMETPGLGARIEEDWFLSQFRNRLFVQAPDADDVTKDYEFISETQEPETSNQLKRVTGATITSDSVLRMLRAEFNLIYRQMQGLKS
ncbi:MAG: FMN-binding protein [Candidatus Cloacimonetes bacterium]|jgi:Na+-transporting NADH:ubiquinone oxidoreductase subunit C|nr:FMN-binding protein [Candidatus Cloacimonadota bacterium]MDY0337683.1 FMN-binding protein [Candidatus Cloacimonadaceae bacterium]MCB5268603.1 FMN-binding protein [Candidatus Cloacimonadota bacterium]MCK9333911.1 FMN-binding protein [Candidatus Cloacimonadota bacterium]MDD2544195.1 FMN-binding protein [Candidatus Cloacimonadota bacterium]